MLVYGVFAAIGNILGGKITDSLGVNRANILIVGGIIIIALGMWVFSGSAVMMGILVALLGMFTFGAVPALQARLIRVASEKAPHAAGVASGLNIAGFNSGIALGSVTGAFTISSMGLYIPVLQVLFCLFWDFCCCFHKLPRVKHTINQ